MEQLDLFCHLKKNSDNLLIQGDSSNFSLLPESCCDLIITSPPYNLGKAYNDNQEDEINYDEYLFFSHKWISNCFYWIRDSGRLCINVCLDNNKKGRNPLSADITKIAMSVGWKYHATIIWDKNNLSKRTAWGSWKSASSPYINSPVETIIIFYKNQWKRERQGSSDINKEEFMEWVSGLWKFNGESSKRIGHEAPFPRELPKRCIKLLSFPGDIVLDPFAGSGTTMIETIKNNRYAMAIEKEKHYCDLIIKRIAKECEIELEILQNGRH